MATAPLDIPALHDPDRDLWVVPIRHHSPACAAHLDRMIADIAPAAILVEGPCDFDPLIELVCDPRTRAPVAVVAMRDLANDRGGREDAALRRAVSYFPFCAHSPELIALQAAQVRGIPARFIDLPSTAREMTDEADDQTEPGQGPGRSLLGNEHPFDVGDYVTALARELGCRDGNEVWDQLFETRLAGDDWQGFFADVGRYCACIRAASDPGDMKRDGTLAREAQMRALVARARAEFAGPIIAVVGGFHAGALFETVDKDAVQPPAKGAKSYLIRYGMRQLDALSGYGAGLPLPGYYDRLWQKRESGAEDLAREIITGFAAHLRKDEGGDESTKAMAPSFPAMVNAVEQAERLAMLRGRPFPARDDVIDAIRSSFIKDEIPVADVPLLVELRRWLTGHAMGEVPPSAGSPPLVEAVREQARKLGFSISDGDRRNRELDIYRKPRHRTASRFCHAMMLIGTSFANRTAGPDFRNDAALDRLHEIWSVGWSPQVEARLIELSEVADTLDEALAAVLAWKLAALENEGRGRSALAAIDLFVAATRAGLHGAAGSILQLVETQIVEDPELASLVAALTDLVLLRRWRDALGIEDMSSIDRIIAAAWRRILILLPEMADYGEDQLRGAITTLADLRGLIELARSSAASIDTALFDEALAQLSQRGLMPALAGAVLAFSLIDGQADMDLLEQRLLGELKGGYVDPADRLAFLGGIIAIARELLWITPAIINAINEVVRTADEQDFLSLLPHLRLALMPLDPREIDRLAEEVAVRIGARPGDLAGLIAIPEGEMTANLALDRELAQLLEQDGMA